MAADIAGALPAPFVMASNAPSIHHLIGMRLGISDVNIGQVSWILDRLHAEGLLMRLPIGVSGAEMFASIWDRDSILSERNAGRMHAALFGFEGVYSAMSHTNLVGIEGKRRAGDDLDLGSGCLIEPDLVLTARHCLEDVYDHRVVWVHDKGETRWPILQAFTPLNLPDGTDLALAKLGQADGALQPWPRAVRTRDPRPAEDVLALGFPMLHGIGFTPIGSKGHIAGRGPNYLSKQDVLILNLSSRGGASGGPVFGQDGRLVGVVSQSPGSEQSNEVEFDALPGIVSLLERLRKMPQSRVASHLRRAFLGRLLEALEAVRLFESSTALAKSKNIAQPGSTFCFAAIPFEVSGAADLFPIAAHWQPLDLS